VDTVEKIKEIISEQTGVDTETLSESTTMEDIMADSLDTVELLMSVEEAFDIEISDSEAEDLTNLGELCRCVEKKLLG
jgi:acyl carrier protein